MSIQYIYALSDPRDLTIRYVGVSGNPKRRYREHIRQAYRYGHYTARWIKSLLRQNVQPELSILFQFEPMVKTERNSVERRWIAMMKAEGHKLTNGTNGGDGFDSETVKAFSDARGIEGRKAIAAKVLATLGMDGIKSRNEKIKAALGKPEIRAIRSALSQQMWDNRDCDDRAAIGAKIAKTQADRGDEWRKTRAAKQQAARYATREIPLGIYYSSSHQKWVTTATKLQAGKRLHIGSFDTLEEAIEEQKRYYDSGLRPFERHPKGIHRSENGKSWCVRSLVSKIGRSKYIGMADTIEAAIAMQNEFHTLYKAAA